MAEPLLIQARYRNKLEARIAEQLSTAGLSFEGVERTMEAQALTPPSVAHDLRLTPQAKLVLSYLKKHGNISPMEAERGYGISRLASCIHEIRNVGYFVHSAMRRDDYGHKYARYEFVNRVN
jgi:hypothetical protein